MNGTPHTIGRRRLLTGTAGLAAGVVAATAAADLVDTHAAAAAPTDAPNIFTSDRPGAPVPPRHAQYPTTAFVDAYRTNTTDNLSPETNAAARILSGMEDLWQTGTSWDNGVVVDRTVLGENVRYCVATTTERADADAKQSFIFDRQHQSYSALGGLGPLEGLYKTGARAVTSITAAPDGVPDGRVSDAVPADAPAGSATGAGSPDSDLGLVVSLVNTVRGPHSSSNPSKFTYNYPRPWRLNADSEVVETDGIRVLGHPVYESETLAAPQLLRQRADDPATDGGFPSGHTNAAWLAALAFAYAMPERYQELLTRAADVSQSRITAGMHSPVDVIGGRILATGLAAAILHDPANTDLKAAARAQARDYFTDRTGTDDLHAYAHREGTDTDAYADPAANRERYAAGLTYTFGRKGSNAPMSVPKGAEVLLETRQPYLSAEQRREVLRTTGLPAGYPLLDGPELWGRLDLFAAADGYGRFDGDVRVTMDAALGGFHAADTWRNDIAGSGKLMKTGTGALALAGENSFTGEVYVEAGTVAAASTTALGAGNVQVKGGSLRTDIVGVRVKGSYTQAGAALDVLVDDSGDASLAVAKSVRLETGSVLKLRLDPQRPPAPPRPAPGVAAPRREGGVDRVPWLAVVLPPLAGSPVQDGQFIGLHFLPNFNLRHLLNIFKGMKVMPVERHPVLEHHIGKNGGTGFQHKLLADPVYPIHIYRIGLHRLPEKLNHIINDVFKLKKCFFFPAGCHKKCPGLLLLIGQCFRFFHHHFKKFEPPVPESGVPNIDIHPCNKVMRPDGTSRFQQPKIAICKTIFTGFICIIQG
jgi:autotransporter-associated beta strand protein